MFSNPFEALKDGYLKRKTIHWDGSYQCTTCNEIVEGAEYSPATDSATWVCSQGHETVKSG